VVFEQENIWESGTHRDIMRRLVGLHIYLQLLLLAATLEETEGFLGCQQRG
jgi:hypothetical protein